MEEAATRKKTRRRKTKGKKSEMGMRTRPKKGRKADLQIGKGGETGPRVPRRSGEKSVTTG